jgi:hypothetical protein
VDNIDIPCVTCGLPIPIERIVALPDTLHCASCSPVRPRKARVVYDHKTAPTTVFMSDEEFLNLQRLDRRGRKRTKQYY